MLRTHSFEPCAVADARSVGVESTNRGDWVEEVVGEGEGVRSRSCAGAGGGSEEASPETLAKG